MDLGVTVLTGRGGFSQTEKGVLMPGSETTDVFRCPSGGESRWT